MAKLGEVCDILNGYAFKSNQYTTSGVRIIRISNVQKGYIEDKSPVYYPCDDENVKKYELKQNDLLISLTGNVGRTALLEEKFLPAALNQRVSCVRLKEPDKVLKTYLFHLLNSDYFEQQCMKAAEGVAQKNLSPKWLFEYKIPIYSIERQKEISNTLDKIDLLIILRKQQLAKLDELVKARFVEMFGERSSIRPQKLKEVTRRVKVGFVGTCEKYYTDNTGVPMLRTTNITSHGIDLKDLKYVTRTFHEKNLKSRVHKGDLLIARHGSNGQANVYCGDEAQCLNAIIIEPDHNITNPIFLENLINSRSVKRQIEKELVGSTQHVLNTTTLANVEVKIPAIKEQQVFAAFVERVDQQKETVQQSLEKLELMKKALMQEYFG